MVKEEAFPDDTPNILLANINKKMGSDQFLQSTGLGIPISIPNPTEKRIEGISESCVFKGTLAGVVGGAMGIVFGVFTSAVDPNITGDNYATGKTLTTKEVYKEMAARSKSYAKSFAFLGLGLSGAECVIESYRGKSDIYNALYAGCAVGGAMGLRAGVVTGCVSCVGFATFSAAIDLYMKS